MSVRNKPATEPVMLKVCNVKLSLALTSSWYYICTLYYTPNNEVDT